MRSIVISGVMVVSIIVWGSTAGADAPLCSGAGGNEAAYTAVAGKSGAELSAKIILPTPGYTVVLKERPEKVLPPMFNFLCEPPPAGMIVAQVLKEYRATAKVAGAPTGSNVTVYDAKGAHKVPVVDK